MAQLQQVQLANNTSEKATNDSVSALTVETRELRAALAQTQQQLAIFTRAPAGAPPANPPTWPHVQAPPHSHITPLTPAYAPIPYAPTAYPMVPLNIYQPTQQTIYRRGGRKWRTGGRGRGGRTCNGGQSYAPTATAPQPYVGRRPAANMNGRTNSTPNPNKNYNNWNMCFSCGYDIPSWHTSATCENRKHGHQTGCTHTNAEQYTALCYYVSRRAINKVNLPVNPGIHQA